MPWLLLQQLESSVHGQCCFNTKQLQWQREHKSLPISG